MLIKFVCSYIVNTTITLNVYSFADGWTFFIMHILILYLKAVIVNKKADSISIIVYTTQK